MNMKFEKKLLGEYIYHLIWQILFGLYMVCDWSPFSKLVNWKTIWDFITTGFFKLDLTCYDHMAVLFSAALWVVLFLATMLVIIFNKRPKNVAHLILSLLFGVALTFNGLIVVTYLKVYNLVNGTNLASSAFIVIESFKNLSGPQDIINLLPTVVPLIIVLIFAILAPMLTLFILDLKLFFKSIFGKKEDEDDEDEDEDEDDKKSKKNKKDKDEKKEKHFYNGIEFIKAFEYYYNYSPKTVLTDEDLDTFFERAKQDTMIKDKKDEIPSYNAAKPAEQPKTAEQPKPAEEPKQEEKQEPRSHDRGTRREPRPETDESSDDALVLSDE